MTAVTGSDETRSATPEVGSRAAALVRVGVLAVAGLGITFTATLHEQLTFDRLVVALTFAALAASHVFIWTATARSARTSARLLLAVVSLVAAIAMLFVGAPIAFALVLAAWALISGLLEFIGGALGGAAKQDATLMGATGVLLAVLALLFRDDQVAALGFFGAYAIVGAVFLGISAFDGNRRPASGAAPVPGN